MRFLHTSDLHLGRTLGEFDLEEDQKFILDRIIELALEHSVDGVLLAGDIFDRSLPPENAVRLFDRFLTGVSDAGIRIFCISGNHDSSERLKFGSGIFEKNNIHIAGDYDGELKKVTLEDAFGKVDVWMLPFIKASFVKHYFPEETIENYQQAVELVMERAGVDHDRRNIIIAHQFVAGKNGDPELGGSEGVMCQTVGNVDRISASAFQDFDYVALGHIHSPQSVGENYIRYSGSPLKYSVDEAMDEKSAVLITLGEKGNVDIEKLELKPKRDVRHIRGELEILISTENVTDTDDYIFATLTDADIVNDAMGIIQQYYPKTVKINYDNPHTRELEMPENVTDVGGVSLGELMGDFYRLIYGSDMSDEERELLEEIAGGVWDETC